MSDKPISVGDLVMVVRTSLTENLGKIGTVVAFAGDQSANGWVSGLRWWVRFPSPLLDNWGEKTNPSPVLNSALKRIPPAEELGLTRTDETIKETA